MDFRRELREPLAAQWPVPPVGVLRLCSGVGDGVAQEIGRHAQAGVITPAFELPDGTKFNRAPTDMRSWEIHATYRLAWHLACFLPSVQLAQPLANWLCMAQRELEERGEWRPESLPPQSVLGLLLIEAIGNLKWMKDERG
jgi:hypothetical protein